MPVHPRSQSRAGRKAALYTRRQAPKQLPLLLEQAPLGERHDFAIPDHHVVQDPDIHQRQRVAQAPGDRVVGRAGFGHAARVIVRQDDRGSAALQGLAHDLAGVHCGAIQRAAEHFAVMQHPVPVVEEDDREHLVRPVTQAGGQQLTGLAGTGQGSAPGKAFREESPRDLECCLQLAEFRVTEAGCLAEAGPVRREQPAEAAEFGEQVAGKVDRGPALEAGPQENGEELGVGKRGRAPQQQFFTRPLVRGPFPDSHRRLLALDVVASLPASYLTPLISGPCFQEIIAVTAKRILLGVTGGIAAYKSADLVRRLRERGADVQVVMTGGAQEFITATTLQAVSHHPVRDSLWDPAAEAAMGHIELARWADVVLVAPATANFIARLAHGLADDLLTTLCLATQAPLVIAPAMNWAMWQNPATRANCETLQARGVQLLGPGEGALAEGESGVGRMLEPLDIAETLLPHDLENLVDEQGVPLLRGVRAVVTAGPTREPIDPVRYISNRSSGKMGYAIARALTAAGAKVTLISGPVNLPVPFGVDVQHVETAGDMYDAVIHRVDHMDIFVGTAAVADYTPDRPAITKIKKEQGSMELSLGRTRDILATVAASGRPVFTVGFAAETNDLETHARHKLKTKKLDMVAANWVGEGRGFDTDENALHVYWQGGSTEIPEDDKQAVARKLVSLVASHYRRTNKETQ